MVKCLQVDFQFREVSIYYLTDIKVKGKAHIQVILS